MQGQLLPFRYGALSWWELTSVTVAEGREASTYDHQGAPDDDGSLAAIVVGNVGRDEERDDGTNVEHVDEDAELVVVRHVISEEVGPALDLLGRVEEHTIVAGGGRGDHQNDGVQVKLAKMRLLGPADLLEPRSLSLC